MGVHVAEILARSVWRWQLIGLIEHVAILSRCAEGVIHIVALGNLRHPHTVLSGHGNYAEEAPFGLLTDWEVLPAYSA